MAAPVHEHAFWSSEDTDRWIEEFCAGDRAVTILVGAGSSMEIGLPSWTGLLGTLLDRMAVRLGVPEANRHGVGTWASEVLAAEGVAGAGEVVRAHFGAEFEQEVTRALYDRRADIVPGPTARAIARLYQHLDGRCEIATLNYDFLLEEALVEEARYDLGSVRAVADAEEHPDCVVVRHLHGARGPLDVGARFADVGSLVLSERDYLLPRAVWQEDWVVGRLINSRCIFVGIGMSDANVLRYLYRSERLRSATSPEHAAILHRTPALTTEQRIMRATREKASALRWEGSGVKTIWVDHFVQSCQILHELAYRLADFGNYRPYRVRMTEWESEMRTELLQTEDRARFKLTQDLTQEILEEALDFVRELLESDVGGLPTDERFGLHLWVRRFSDRALSLWCASDRAWRDPSTLSNVPISRAAEWISISAFCHGTPVDAQIESGASRWAFVRGYPIFIDDALWGRLPVGVVTLASTKGGEEGTLSGGLVSGATLDDIWQHIQDVASGLLTPAGNL